MWHTTARLCIATVYAPVYMCTHTNACMHMSLSLHVGIVCMYAHVYVCVVHVFYLYICTQRSEEIPCFICLHFIPVRQVVSQNLELSCWPATLHTAELQVTYMFSHVAFSLGAGDLNSGPRDCAESAHPRSLLFKYRHIAVPLWVLMRLGAVVSPRFCCLEFPSVFGGCSHYTCTTAGVEGCFKTQLLGKRFRRANE